MEYEIKKVVNGYIVTQKHLAWEDPEKGATCRSWIFKTYDEASCFVKMRFESEVSNAAAA